MMIDTLNLNHLRIFECVYSTRSMTRASQELHLTQSGVSQHIKSLEEVLNVRLFDRVKQRIIPTEEAHRLYKKVRESLYSIENVLLDIKGGDKTLRGMVTLGVPLGFGNNVVLPLLAEFARANPQVRFTIRYGFVNELNNQILNGELDFALVDAFGVDPRIATEKAFDEVLELCAHEDQLKPGFRENATTLEQLEYVDYQPDEPILRMWFKHHFGKDVSTFNVRATAMDVMGVARFITAGLAAGVLPAYLIPKVEGPGVKIVRFKGSGKPLKNTIQLAYLKERTRSPAVNAAMGYLLDRLKEDGAKKPL